MIITDGVYKLDCTKGAYAYTVKNGEDVTLIDTGIPGKADAIIAELDRYGIGVASVKSILVTHHDIDHIGNIAYLQEKSGCQVYIHPLDYPVLMEGVRRDGLKAIGDMFWKVKPPASVKKLDGAPAAGFEAIPCPGHTRGHTAYRFKKTVFVGDLITVKKRAVKRLGRMMTWNMETLIKSIKNFPAHDIEWICPAHGEPVRIAGWNEVTANIK